MPAAPRSSLSWSYLIFTDASCQVNHQTLDARHHGHSLWYCIVPARMHDMVSPRFFYGPDILERRIIKLSGALLFRRPLTWPGFSHLLWTLFRLFSGVRMEVQTTTVKVDRVGEVLLIPKSSCCVLHPLDLGVDELTSSVGHPVPQVSDDVLEAALQHSPHFDHGFQPATHRPVVPPQRKC